MTTGQRQSAVAAPLKRMRLELGQFGAEVLLVGDRLEEGGRYVQLIVDEHGQAVWDAIDYLNAFDRLEREWQARFACASHPGEPQLPSPTELVTDEDVQKAREAAEAYARGGFPSGSSAMRAALEAYGARLLARHGKTPTAERAS